MRHTLVLTTAAALLLGGAALTPAVAATTIGGTGGQVQCNAAAPGAVLLGSGSSTYAAAAPGVITGYSTQANAVAGQVRIIVFGPGAAALQRSVVTASPRVSVTPSTLNTFAVRVPIAAGQQIGLGYTVSGMACATIGAATDRTWIATGFDPDSSSTFNRSGELQSGSRSDFRPNISAVIEADADGDGFGDETQDACPQSALTQVACPTPDTTVTKGPKAKRANPRVKVKFSATVAGSTFECQLDGKAWKACTSPFRKKFKVGKHKLKIRAVSPFGLVDGTPAKVKTEITR